MTHRGSPARRRRAIQLPAVVVCVVACVYATAVPTFAQDTHQHDAGPMPPGMHAAATGPQEASGTAWSPAEGPLHAFEWTAGAWRLMAHGTLFAQFIDESGTEHHGGHQAGSINWLMGAASRPLAGGRFNVRSMLSLEPWTIGGCGYPDLLATGEVCDGDTIHDRQHPHDLVMELSAAYDRPLTPTLRWQVYGGPAGEPALGPPAFPHRLSAFENPMAPIAHHWLDSTHIAFGVITGALSSPRWKAEASVFNGREPDERRADLDLGALDSLSARLSFAPSRAIVLQGSAGHLREAEAGLGSQPRTDVDRATVSAAVHRRLAGGGLWATTLAYGVKWETALLPEGPAPQTTHAVLLESALLADDRQTWFGRVEVVGKPAHALHAHEFGALVFTVGKLEAGYVRHARPWRRLVAGVGGAGMLSIQPSLLAPRYGGTFAPGVVVFAVVRPAAAAGMVH